VLVIGPGQQGLGCVIGARDAGSERIIVAGRKADLSRLQVARALGADDTVDVDAEDLAERVRMLTDGRGVDIAIDTAAANDATIGAALAALRDKGGIALVAAGAMDQTLERFPVGVVKRKYATVKGVRGHSHAAVERALAIIASGRYPLDSLATHRFGLDRVDEALRAATAGGDAIHVAVTPGGA
jgi:threonine dehydrogenase-like Zn-dependent dehydrogenase